MRYLKNGFVVCATVSMFLMGCSEEQSTKEPEKKVQKDSAAPEQGFAQKSAERATEKLDQAAKEIDEKTQLVKQELQEGVETAKDMVQKSKEISQKVVQTSKEVSQEVEKKIEAAKEEVRAVVEQKSGAEIYKTCASCHGQKAEKAALGKSQVIQGWEVSKTLSALQGYKDGSYGGAMKGMMKGQVSKLSDEDMKRVAEHISKL